MVANNGVGIDVTQNTNITSASSYANSAFTKANTDFTGISVSSASYGSASLIPVFTLEANGRISAISTASASGGGGVTISNDTTTNSNGYYPVLSTATSGTASTVYTSSTKFYFNPSTGTINATTFNSLSDEKAKTNIQKITDALSKITTLGGYTYLLIDNNEPSAGLLAQEVQKVLPEAVRFNSDTGLLSLNYNAVLGMVVESINELEQRVKNLEDAK